MQNPKRFVKRHLSLNCFLSFLILSDVSFATRITNLNQKLAPQPAPSCVTATFKNSIISGWANIILTITNGCTSSLDFRDAAITFTNNTAISTTFWGTFTPMSYPQNTNITSQAQTGGKFSATIPLTFGTESWVVTKLPTGGSFIIKYGQPTVEYNPDTVRVYLAGTPVDLGEITLNNQTVRPTDIVSTTTTVNIASGGQTTPVQVPWGGSIQLTNLATGTYTVQPANVSSASGVIYQGTATPSSISLSANSKVTSNISYAAITNYGAIQVQAPALPAVLAGYNGVPMITLTRPDSGATVSQAVNWANSTKFNQLVNNTSYRATTPSISHNGFRCQALFTPNPITSSNPTATITNLSYDCVTIPQAQVNVSISGLPTSMTSLTVNFTPNDGSMVISQIITLNNGSGLASIKLTDGAIYQVSTSSVTGYSASFTPQPLTATSTATESIRFTLADATPVSKNGRLSVCGTHLCNERNEQIQLRGMSTHGLQWYGPSSSHNCLTTASLDNLAKNWRADILRISMYIQEGGYETNPSKFTTDVNNLIAEVSKRGMYALVDWHMLTPGDPNYNLERAKTFFRQVATQNKDRNNLLYEIANEPNGVAWSKIKTYAEALIPVIRGIDAKTPIIVGTAGWSSLGISDGKTSQDIINAPVKFDNIMYTFHFYAASHKDIYINELDKASNTLPIFVTEFGSQTYTGDGADDFVTTGKYMDLMAKKKISWTNWNYSDDKRTGAVWVLNTCSNGPWTDSRLKSAGAWIKAKIIEAH